MAILFPPAPLAASKIAKALGLEGQPIDSISINLFNDGASIVSVTYFLEADADGELAEVLKDYVLVGRDPETGGPRGGGSIPRG